MNPSLPRSGRTLVAFSLITATAAAQVGGTNGVTEVVSRDSTGAVAADGGSYPSLSADGRYVAFLSDGALVPADDGLYKDAYVYDRETGTVVAASTSLAGVHANWETIDVAISGDGRWVAFATRATNLVTLDNIGLEDIFVKDLQTGVVVRASNAYLSPFAGNGFSLAPSISDDGRYVAFQSRSSDLILGDTNGKDDIFVYDVQTNQTQRVSEGILGEANGHSTLPAISGDGTHVAYESLADNLLLFDFNLDPDVFLVEIGQLPVLVSRTPFGGFGDGPSRAPAISFDGSVVAFESNATDLVPIDSNGSVTDVFVYDAEVLATEVASLDHLGNQLMGSADTVALSRNGRVVTFDSTGDFAPLNGMFHNVYMRDLDAAMTWTMDRPTGSTGSNAGSAGLGAIAANGAIVAFVVAGDDFDPEDNNGDEDVYLRNVHRDPFEYGSPSLTFHGCLPNLEPFGFSSVTGATDLTLVGDSLPNQKTGLLFYGFEGAAANPWGGATMYVAGKKKRTPLMNTGGNAMGDDCSGFIAYNMNHYAAGLLGGTPKPELSIVGQQVNVQFWGRDPLSASGTLLSTAVEYIVGP